MDKFDKTAELLVGQVNGILSLIQGGYDYDGPGMAAVIAHALRMAASEAYEDAATTAYALSRNRDIEPHKLAQCFMSKAASLRREVP